MQLLGPEFTVFAPHKLFGQLRQYIGFGVAAGGADDIPPVPLEDGYEKQAEAHVCHKQCVTTEPAQQGQQHTTA